MIDVSDRTTWFLYWQAYFITILGIPLGSAMPGISTETVVNELIPIGIVSAIIAFYVFTRQTRERRRLFTDVSTIFIALAAALFCIPAMAHSRKDRCHTQNSATALDRI